MRNSICHYLELFKSCKRLQITQFFRFSKIHWPFRQSGLIVNIEFVETAGRASNESLRASALLRLSAGRLATDDVLLAVVAVWNRAGILLRLSCNTNELSYKKFIEYSSKDR